jgi:MFS family permease
MRDLHESADICTFVQPTGTTDCGAAARRDPGTHYATMKDSDPFMDPFMLDPFIKDSDPFMNAAPFAPPRLSRARWATRAQFLNLGCIAGVWGVHIPSVKARYALDERTLAAALLATSVGSLLTLAIAGPIVGRLGPRYASAMAGIGFCIALASSLLMPGLLTLCCAMLLLGMSESVFDVSINAEGSTLEKLSGRAIMSGFHGMFSVGAMIGSAVAAVMLRLDVPAWMQLCGVAALVAVSVVIASQRMLTEHPRAADDQAHFTWPRGTLLLIGMLICCGMLAEGVMYNWSVLYVKQELHTSQSFAAVGYVSFAAATAAMRFAGDWVRARMPERQMLLAGPALAAVAMLLVVLIATPWMAMLGFALVGVGLATVVPILYNAATRVPGVSPAAAIASVSSIGYVGFMIGPPIIGGIAHASSLTIAMGFLSVASMILVLGSRRVPEAPPRGTAPAPPPPYSAASTISPP